MVERVRREHHQPGLFIGRLGPRPGGEIFLAAMLIHHILTRLTSFGHVAIAGACPRAHRSALEATSVAQRGGDHGIGVDELTVREERGEEKKGGRRGVLRSHRVTANPRWYRGGAGGR